jgi:DNA-directed RNA polymerase specialized sigma24 family protein
MRRVLLDHARKHTAGKRGGAARPIPLDLAGELPAAAPNDLEVLDEALGDLAALDATAAAVVELRFFGGLSVEETGGRARLLHRDRRATVASRARVVARSTR